MDYLTDNFLHAGKKKCGSMVLKFTVAHIFLLNDLIVSYLPCTQAKKFVVVNSKVTVVHTGFWKLCTAAVHVDTEWYPRLSMSATHTCTCSI